MNENPNTAVRKLQTAAALWARNIRAAEFLLAIAQEYGAATAPFEAKLAEARKHYDICLAGLQAASLLEAIK